MGRLGFCALCASAPSASAGILWGRTLGRVNAPARENSVAGRVRPPARLCVNGAGHARNVARSAYSAASDRCVERGCFVRSAPAGELLGQRAGSAKRQRNRRFADRVTALTRHHRSRGQGLCVHPGYFPATWQASSMASKSRMRDGRSPSKSSAIAGVGAPCSRSSQRRSECRQVSAWRSAVSRRSV